MITQPIDHVAESMPELCLRGIGLHPHGNRLPYHLRPVSRFSLTDTTDTDNTLDSDPVNGGIVSVSTVSGLKNDGNVRCATGDDGEKI